MFSKIEDGAARCQLSASVPESDSPQKRLRRSVGNAPGFNNPSLAAKIPTEGTENHTVNSYSSIVVTGTSVCSGKQQSVAPASQEANKSCTLRSNVRSKFCENRS